MATYQAVNAISRAIVDVLESAARKAGFADVQFALFRSEDFAQPMIRGVSVHLYKVTTAAAMRNSLRSRELARGQATSPLALDLHYLIAAWGQDTTTEHHLLTWAMAVLHENAVLTAAQFNEAHAGVFRDDETMTLIREDLTLTDALLLWSGLGSRYRVSASYLARVAVIDSSAASAEPLTRNGI